MHSTSIGVGIILAALSSVAATQAGQQVQPLPAPDQLERFRQQMATMSPVPPPPGNGAIASTIAQWRALQQTDALPFDSYASFLLAHPDWPGETANRRAAERQAATATPARAVSFFLRYPPMTAGGTAAQANALLALGRQGEAQAAARRAFRMASLSPSDEATILARFGGAMLPADYDERMDALLWGNQTTAATRILGNTSLDRRAAFVARLALRTNAADAATLAMSSDPALLGDPGYVADRATWLRNSGAGPTARLFLAQPRTLVRRPGNVEAWYEVLLANARGAAADGQWQLAYDIARQVDDAYPPATDVSVKPYGERDDYTSLVWLAGQAALKQLNRPADAMPLFERYGHGSKAPQTRAKGFYWAARAAEAAGIQPQAASLYSQAANYRDQFYGQLAMERTGKPLTAPPPLNLAAVDPGAKAEWESRDLVKAVRFLGQIADWQDQTAFIREIAADASSETDHILAAQLAAEIGRPDLGVMVGRNATQNGLSDYSAAGFPTVTVPAGYEDNWTIIHAIARQESQFDRTAVSHAGARGLMQLMPGTAREQSGKMGLSYEPASLTSDPNLSIMLGSSYFQRIYNNYGSYPLAIAAYNAGGGNVNKWLRANGDPRTGAVDMVDWIEAIPFQETRNYVQRVIENAVVYDLLNPGRAKSRGAPSPLAWYLGRTRASG